MFLIAMLIPNEWPSLVCLSRAGGCSGKHLVAVAVAVAAAAAAAAA